MEWKTEEEFKVHEAAPPLHLVRSQEDGLGLDYKVYAVLCFPGRPFFLSVWPHDLARNIQREASRVAPMRNGLKLVLAKTGLSLTTSDVLTPPISVPQRSCTHSLYSASLRVLRSQHT